jgi:hypothetical protein
MMEQQKTQQPETKPLVGFMTSNNKMMAVKPNTVIMDFSGTAMYIVSESGSWIKFAEQHKGKWKVLRFTQEMFDIAKQEIDKLRDEAFAEVDKAAELANEVA